MIRPEDLRIGNWLQDQSGYFKVRAIELGVTFLDEPIPLTEEILVKAGFKKEKYFAGGQDEWAGLTPWSLNGNWIFRGNSSNLRLVGYFNTSVQYLHDLQNLYYALTKQELTIDL
jgi:hypothetical protein